MIRQPPISTLSESPWPYPTLFRPNCVRELRGAGLRHGGVRTVSGTRADYASEPVLVNDELHWQAAPADSRDENMLRPVSAPFSPDGGMRLLAGNLGRAIIKTSAEIGSASCRERVCQYV